MRRLSRRTFLQSATAATLAAKLNPATAQTPAQTAAPYPENGTLIPDDDWRLWIDEQAEWKNDPLFLSEDIAEGVLHGKGTPLPVNEPTGGWGLLDHLTGIDVTLPTTVEQHFWGKFGAGENKAPRPYTPEEYPQ
jgi:beta-galactosidase